MSVKPFLLCLLTSASVVSGADRRSALRFEISVDRALSREPVDGRILLLLSTRTDGEPRLQAASRRSPQPLFGIDVEGLEPGKAAVIDDKVLGYPVESLSGLPAREYRVQAVLNVYTTFKRSDGHLVKLHNDQWEGQQWSTSPGNLYSKPETLRVDPQAGGTIPIRLTEKIPPLALPKDTRYVKHFQIKSEAVSRFWGHDMFVGAVVLLPEGFDEHPDARYPVAYLQGHFTPTFRGFREEPPETGVAAQESAYAFYREWIGKDFPRMLVVVPLDPNPFYDDSYAVNSANVGPYGDALTKELIPYVEKKFRGIGEPWARTLYGGSTGGWRALALQVLYPDFFNGAWVFCPDPVDFRYFQLVNIYSDDNAYYPPSEWKRTPLRAWMRSEDDQVLMTQKDASTLEAVLGSRGRSGEQMDIFQAVYGPVGPDGYPRILYDKSTGVIDKGVVDYWRENYDLSHILRRDWVSLGPKLQGKLHIYMGDTDTYYLEEATMLLEKFLASTENPHSDGTVEYGKRAPHCWTGAPPGKNVTAHYLPKMAEHIRRTAPAGADLSSWKY